MSFLIYNELYPKLSYFEFYIEFEEFLKLSIDEQLKILPFFEGSH